MIYYIPVFLLYFLLFSILKVKNQFLTKLLVNGKQLKQQHYILLNDSLCVVQLI